MFQDMGEVSGHALETLRAKAQARLEIGSSAATISAGWPSPADKPETIVSGAGVQLQPILPRPLITLAIGEGRQGTIVNVFTEQNGAVEA